MNGAEWLQSLTEPPLLQYSPAAQFLNSYFPDGVGLSPTLNDWKQDVEDSTGTILFNRKMLGHGFGSHWSLKCFFRVNLQYCLNCNYHCDNHIFFKEVLLLNTQVTLKLLHWLNMIMFQPRICETVSPPRKHWNSTYLSPWHYGIRRERSFPRISQVFYINSIKITLILITKLNHKSSITCWN